MVIWLKHFHDSLNIVVTFAPGQEFFSARYALLSLKSKKIKINDEHFPLKRLLFILR